MDAPMMPAPTITIRSDLAAVARRASDVAKGTETSWSAVRRFIRVKLHQTAFLLVHCLAGRQGSPALDPYNGRAGRSPEPLPIPRSDHAACPPHRESDASALSGRCRGNRFV